MRHAVIHEIDFASIFSESHGDVGHHTVTLLSVELSQFHRKGCLAASDPSLDPQEAVFPQQAKDLIAADLLHAQLPRKGM